ncbi:uncharacterized protein TM35_000073080 [Trypanosoma theileri]|uniref:Uncharacterized protein n=1 Tax=Trypanosoma theileri TaxID=67003 RepID=A0A1X0P1Q4_9TRYP|nr:uncharacterized protein TM35_000073080 [Trypanosoma theileri]ORC90884.1 hypothetical protein TM35_000073080 [Trypanosoma theileri]
MAFNVSQERLEDEARLLFSVEVLLANIPSLITDLSSAKYALLSLTDKYRNEVKQKSMLIPSVSERFRELLDLRSQLQSDQEKLSELETKIVSSAPPKFISKEEAYTGSTTSAGYTSNDYHNDNEKMSIRCEEDPRNASSELLSETRRSDILLDNNEEGTKYIPQFGNNSNNRAVVFLEDEDLQKVQEAELKLEEERNELANLAKETNSMEDRFEIDRSRCEAMTKHVQGLKWDYEKTHTALIEARNERQQYELFQHEWKERKIISDEADKGLREIFGLCCRDELSIIAQALEDTRGSITNCSKALADKISKNEVELAVYQIAYKEQQAAAEELKEAIIHLQHHQRELELLAKRQEIEETKRNSIRQLLMSSLYLSPGSSEVISEELQPEHKKEIEDEHQMVSLLATRVGVMEERRREIAAILMRLSPTEEDIVRLKTAVEQVRSILMEELIINEETIRDVDSS